jgi:hypothetical protein
MASIISIFNSGDYQFWNFGNLFFAPHPGYAFNYHSKALSSGHPMKFPSNHAPIASNRARITFKSPVFSPDPPRA